MRPIFDGGRARHAPQPVRFGGKNRIIATKVRTSRDTDRVGPAQQDTRG